MLNKKIKNIKASISIYWLLESRKMATKPLHKKISDDLREKILTGIYEVGENIPREIDLAVHYNVSRPTVRKAIATLVSEGYLERVQRKGTTVKNKIIEQDFTYTVESYNTQMTKEGVFPSTKVLSFDTIKANSKISEKLNINLNEKVYKLIRLRYSDELPNVLVTTFLPCKSVGDLSNIDFEKNSLYATLRERNIKIATISRILRVEKSEEILSHLLNINIGDPIYAFSSVAVNEEGVPIEYSISKYRGDINSFRIEVKNNSL